MAKLQVYYPRVVRAAPEPLGWYLRPSYVDHRAIADAVAGGLVGLHGVVFDPLYGDRHSELRHLIVERNRDAILDPRTQELASIGGFNKRLSALPWALDRPHGPDDFADVDARRIVDSIAQFVVKRRYTAVLAPTHYIESADSPWLAIDTRLTGHLRRYLDRVDASNVPIFYSLAVSYEAFRSTEERHAILERLMDLPVDSVWIKVSQSGTLTHAAVRNLVYGATEFHSLGVPLIGDMMGGLRGLSALAFGAVGGICHGVTQKERFSATSWTRPASSSNQGFSRPTGIYVAPLGIHLKREEATAFFGARGSKSRFGCREKACCPKGLKDMVDNPVRHSLVQRSGELRRLSILPEEMRAQHFLEETLRPATDAAVFAESLSFQSQEHLAKRMSDNRKVLERLRVGLGRLVQERPLASFSQIPLRRAMRS
ncbi:MAG: hypothetical protein OXU75_12815 [Deltaproteobacteria bacterium]|nr:hypothetical protein [Deltaproteobacteria bacterium]